MASDADDPLKYKTNAELASDIARKVGLEHYSARTDGTNGHTKFSVAHRRRILWECCQRFADEEQLLDILSEYVVDQPKKVYQSDINRLIGNVVGFETGGEIRLLRHQLKQLHRALIGLGAPDE